MSQYLLSLSLSSYSPSGSGIRGTTAALSISPAGAVQACVFFEMGHLRQAARVFELLFFGRVRAAEESGFLFSHKSSICAQARIPAPALGVDRTEAAPRGLRRLLL